MKWTVSAVKGVGKLSLRCSVIPELNLRLSLPSTLRKALMGLSVSHCDFSADAGPHGSFHLDNITTGQINHATLWTSVTTWLTWGNKTESAASVGGNMPSSHQEIRQESSLIFFFHIISPSLLKGNVRRQRIKKEIKLLHLEHSGSLSRQNSHLNFSISMAPVL